MLICKFQTVKNVLVCFMSQATVLSHGATIKVVSHCKSCCLLMLKIGKFVHEEIIHCILIQIVRLVHLHNSLFLLSFGPIQFYTIFSFLPRDKMLSHALDCKCSNCDTAHRRNWTFLCTIK